MKITRSRARELCLLAAERLDNYKDDYVCCALYNLVRLRKARRPEADILKEALWAVYSSSERQGSVLWPESVFVGLLPRGPREPRIFALLLLPEFFPVR